jgi:DNA-binding transcriptional LysR family regulator
LALLLDNQVADLYKDKVDLAIRIGRPQDSRLKTRKLADNRMVVCASPDYLGRQGIPAKPQDLSSHNCLALNRQRRNTPWHFRHGALALKVPVGGNLSSIGGTPLLEAALQGVGLTLLPAWMAETHLRAGTLMPVLGSWAADIFEGGSGTVYAVYLEDPRSKPALRSFIDYFLTST